MLVTTLDWAQNVTVSNLTTADGQEHIVNRQNPHDVETLIGVLCDLYHVCGMLDAKVEVLDQIIAAINGEPLPCDSLGPFSDRDAGTLLSSYSPKE